jgi:probable rRNA maturation factor
MTGTITIVRETRIDPRFPLSRRELTELISLILEALGLGNDSMEIKLVDDREIARLNESFMGCVGPTNVLSFPAEEEVQEGSAHLGSLAMSVDALARESALYGQPPVLHLARLLAHGILHLAGHDHGDEMYDLTDVAVDHVEAVYMFETGDEVISGSS